MRITTPTILAGLARSTPGRPGGGRGRALLQRFNAYTLWAFNPPHELTSRYDRSS